MAEVDEFTIPRPRWIIPMAIVGAVLLIIVLYASFGTSDDKPVIQRTGTTVVATNDPGSTTTAAR